jgi:hypothetical protein
VLRRIFGLDKRMEKINDSCTSPDNVSIIKPRNMKWTYIYHLARKPKGNRSLERSKHKWVGDIENNLRK